ncbi:FHA domain-containing protein [Kitasatospora sp. NPDC051984]|uniref:FHA domain-containing protein n=1 Tax=Kitasatospora sp. NPDC051984 TaxID=3364059 RepID=UPI0037C699B6
MGRSVPTPQVPNPWRPSSTVTRKAENRPPGGCPAPGTASTYGRARDGAPAPRLVLETGDDSTVISPSRTYSLGRDPAADIVLTDPRVSWHHARLHVGDGHWIVDHIGSTNGTWADGRRIVHQEIEPGTVLCLGSPADGPHCTFSALPRPTAVQRVPGGGPSLEARPSALTAITGSLRPPSRVRPLPTRVVRIGRAPDNDLVLGDLSVSQHHAELRARPDGRYEIADLASHNGTYLNGRPVLWALVGPGDLAGIGHSMFCLVGDELQEFVDTGDIDRGAR